MAPPAHAHRPDKDLSSPASGRHLAASVTVAAENVSVDLNGGGGVIREVSTCALKPECSQVDTLISLLRWVFPTLF